MKLAAVFDISAFIWDKTHFNSNKNDYYSLMNVIPNILEKINVERIPVLFRGELLDEIYTYFPYSDIPNEHFTYQRLTLSYLSKINMVEYPNSASTNITCEPSLVKEFFEHSTKNEINQLVNHLYNENNTIHKLLTFSIFWANSIKMVISNGAAKEVETNLCDNKLEHEAIVKSLKKIFEHNSKHDKYKSGTYSKYSKEISPLSCYNDTIGDTTDAQFLLDTAIYYSGDFFNFDQNHNTYVIFVNTLNNIFHGFNIKPSEADIKIINRMLE